MIITELSIGQLIPYENNPRKNDAAVEVVARSIQEFGFKIPVVIDLQNVIVCGHTRVKAAQKLGLKTVPCLRADDLTEDQIKAFRLADNKTAEYAEWDFEKLEAELKGIEFDMALFDFKMPEPEVADDDFDLEEALDEIDDPITQPGDVWLLGRHRLVCGDSTKPSDMAKLMDNQQADLILTDPPYNVDYEGGTKDKLKIQNDKMNDDKFLQFLTDAFTRMHEHSKKGQRFMYSMPTAKATIFGVLSNWLATLCASVLFGLKILWCLAARITNGNTSPFSTAGRMEPAMLGMVIASRLP